MGGWNHLSKAHREILYPAFHGQRLFFYQKKNGQNYPLIMWILDVGGQNQRRKVKESPEVISLCERVCL